MTRRTGYPFPAPLSALLYSQQMKNLLFTYLIIGQRSHFHYDLYTNFTFHKAGPFNFHNHYKTHLLLDNLVEKHIDCRRTALSSKHP